MTTTDPKVRLQVLRDFTVQIRTSSMDRIVGTGIVVSTDGTIITCAHVVREAGVEPRTAGDATVGVFLAQMPDADLKARQATVLACFTDYDDDVVVLRLVDGGAGLTSQHVAVLGSAASSANHEFRSYGYPDLQQFIAGIANGRILGDVEAPLGKRLRTDPIQLASSQVAGGMSGAGVLDLERNLVVGIVAQTWNPNESTKHRDTAWAVDARVLAFDPLDLPLSDAPLPRQPTTHESTDAEIAAVSRFAAESPGTLLSGAPANLRWWVGRADLLARLDDDWVEEAKRVVGLVGFGGEGKSSLARRWLDRLLDDEQRTQPAGVVWWTFYEGAGANDFFEASLLHLSGGDQSILSRFLTPRDRMRALAAMLHAGWYVVVLDALETVQHNVDDRYGLVTDENLAEFLNCLAAPGHRSFCVITSRIPVPRPCQVHHLRRIRRRSPRPRGRAAST